MGNYVHKLIHNEESKKDEAKTRTTTKDLVVENDGMCTPPLTQRKLPRDPRSVTAGIERTPIEVNCTPVGYSKRAISAIPKYFQSKPYLETDLDKIMPETPRKLAIPKLTESTVSKPLYMESEITQNYLTPIINVVYEPKIITPSDMERYNIFGLDPKSPAADFNGTPRLAQRSIERLRARSQENLSRCGSYEEDVYCSQYSYCEVPLQFNIPEIQTLSDTAVSIGNAYNKERMNESESSCSSYFSHTETVYESGEEITVIENPILKYARINREMYLSSISPDQQIFMKENKLENDSTIAKEDNSNIIVELKQMHSNDNNRIRVWRESLSSEELAEVIKATTTEATNEKTTELSKTEAIITSHDDCVVRKAQSLKISKTDVVTGTKKKTFKSDDDAVTDKYKNRTPLGNRSNNSQAQTLFSKSPQQLFRNKGIIPKMLQENTPPHKRYIAKSKSNGMQWDPDSTIII